MNKSLKTTLFALPALLLFGATAAHADHDRRDNDTADLLLGIASSLLVSNVIDYEVDDRRGRSRHDRDFNRDRDWSWGDRNFRGRDFDRPGYGGASYTSDPIRGGSSRRTRIVENPYPNRPVTGISFTGIERNPVHINDVITYPRKRLISRHGYSLSLYHPSRFLNTRGYVDYISVKAKRREHFTVTFHYD